MRTVSKSETKKQEKQRKESNVRRVTKYRDNKEVEPFFIDGKFDVKGFLEANLPKIAADLLKPGKSIPSKKTEMMLKILDIYKDKQEIKLEYEPDYDRWTENILSKLKDNWREHGGVCCVCGRPDTLDEKLRLHPEPEHSAEGEVAGLEVSASPVEIVSD